MSRRRRLRSAAAGSHLFRKYAAAFVLLVSVVLLASGGVQTWFSYRETESALGRIQQEKAAVAAVRIEQFLAAIRPPIELANQILQNTDPASAEQRRAEYRRVLRQVPAITELRYVDAAETERLRVSRVALDQPGISLAAADAAALLQARPDRPYYSPVSFRGDSEPYLTVGLREPGPDGGVTLADVNLKFILDVVAAIRVGESGIAYVVDAHGRLIAHPDISLVLQNTDVSSLAQVRAAQAETAPAAGERSTALVADDPRGRRVLSAHAPIAGPGWSVFVEQPLGEAFAPLYASLLRSTLLLLGGLVLAVLVSILLARRMVTPIRRLRTGAARIGAGELEQRIEVRTGDELEALAEEFNRMSARLRESYAGLEGKVEERTRDLAAALAELEETSRRLTAADRAKSDFLSRMSHELRTPLNAVIGFAELMERDPQTSAKHREWLGHVLKGGRHLLGLINEVLDIARIEAGRISLSPEPVSVREALDGAIDLVRPLAAARDVAIAFDGAAAPDAYVQADRQRLQQVLLNLLTNAVKYNREGGEVTIACDERPEGRVRVTVKDTGPGIAADRLDRLFTPFERLDAEFSAVEGTGLGLAISRRLVEAMGGAIGVESTLGSGSAFWLELPAAVPPTRRPVGANGVAQPDYGARATAGTVLYVEDNLLNLALVESVVALRPGVRLCAALNGETGLAIARVERPDLVLLDLNLPDLHGEEVLRRLRADARMAALPVVVVSADATERQVRRLLAAGAAAYLTKPIDTQRLLDVLDAHLSPKVAAHAAPGD